MSPYDRGRPWDTVVISPHFDDAALSLAGLLIRGAVGRTAVVTVHGGAPGGEGAASWWDSACGFSSPAEAYAWRLAEDARSCELLGAEQVPLPHADGPYRVKGELLSALEEFIDGLPETTRVLVPLGSNQPDHAAVREQAMAALAARGRDAPWVYGDLPYTGAGALWGTDEADKDLAANEQCGRAYQELSGAYRLETVHDIRLGDEEWAVKRNAVLAHGSQLAALATEHGAFLSRPGPLCSERIWALHARQEADLLQ
jgi:LmbE family N-acetylglucosaminyl deacetylase